MTCRSQPSSRFGIWPIGLNLKCVQRIALDLKLHDAVHFLGFVSLEGLVWLYRQALALTHVTFFGPDNLPPLEAFALGCPVIASRVEGAEEQLGNAALLVDPSDEMQIAEAIRCVCHGANLRVELVTKGKKRAKLFTGKEYVEAILQLLDTLAPMVRCSDWHGYQGA